MNRALLVLPLLLPGLAACGSGSGDASQAPLVTTGAPVTVLADDTHGPQLCMAVMDSLPPQCGGLDLPGWEWTDYDEGDYESMSGTTWGHFVVTGHIEGQSLTPTKVVPARLAKEPVQHPAARPEDDPDHLKSPCPEPAGGWRIVDADRLDRDLAIRTAERLRGFAGLWVDHRTLDLQAEEDAILNVRVTGDTAAAERKLREVWGGRLCVSSAKHTEAELRRIQDEITDSHVPGMTTVGIAHAAGEYVVLEVQWDDGTLQDQMDQKYGKGLVRVVSDLIRVDEK